MSRYQPALLGGLFIGVLSALPVVNIGNCFCCLWVVIGGVLVTYLLQQNKPEPVETGEAVLGGLIAGLIGAVIATIGIFLVSGVTDTMMQDNMREAFEQSGGEVSPEVRDFVLNLLQGRNFVVLMFVITMPIYAVFAMLGSLLGLAFFKKKTPPAPPPPQVLQ
jgi:hypothetical protein